ncbi:MAG: hypothetical protein IIU80_05280 [Clostridia bacterium]|nr:hypothetical protein [Clostridia bacterium]
MHLKNYIKRTLITILALAMVFSAVPVASMAAASKAETIQTIFDFLVDEMGLNSAAACGVLANIEKESNFNPTLYGDSGSSYGICQWHNGRFENLKSFCNKNGYSWKTVEGQLQFLKYELSTNKTDTGKILDRLAGVENTAAGAYKAGYDWCYYFERPANKASKAEARGSNAQTKYWPTYKLVYELGDVNADGKVNATDALIALETAVGSYKASKSQLKAADIDKDGRITSNDALIMLSISSGKLSIENYR